MLNQIQTRCSQTENWMLYFTLCQSSTRESCKVIPLYVLMSHLFYRSISLWVHCHTDTNLKTQILSQCLFPLDEHFNYGISSWWQLPQFPLPSFILLQCHVHKFFWFVSLVFPKIVSSAGLSRNFHLFTSSSSAQDKNALRCVGGVCSQ